MLAASFRNSVQCRFPFLTPDAAPTPKSSMRGNQAETRSGADGHPAPGKTHRRVPGDEWQGRGRGSTGCRAAAAACEAQLISIHGIDQK